MNETLRSVWGNLINRWNGFTPTQRRNIVITTVAIIAALIATLWVFMRPNYVSIMSGLDDKSMGQVQSKLQDLKIPNEINGSTVLVPSQDANTARVQLAMAGLPQSGYIGYSSIQNSFGMTEDQFNIQVLDALQQSLNETIQSMSGIEVAQVHIVMPTQQIFVSQPTQSAKASVFVQVAPGVQLSSAQVAGIQQLVAHSVNGLTADNVTVTDQNGVTLSSVPSSQPGMGTSAAASTELAMRQQLEQEKTQELTSGLNQIVGPGNAVVVVHADVSFNQVQSSSHVVTPVPGTTTGLPTSSQTAKSSSSSTQGQSGGPAGVSSTNPGMPTYVGTAGGTGNSTTSNSTVTVNYDNNYTNTATVGDPMQVKGYSVGVFLNSTGTPLTPAVVNQIKSFVANSIGQPVNAPMNNITVSSVPFHSTVSNPLSNSSNLGLYAGAAGVALLLGAGGWYLVRRRKRMNEQDALLSSDLADASLLNGLPQTEDERMKDQLVHLANQKPDEFASLLRTWLAD